MNRRTILYVMNGATPDDHIMDAAEGAARDENHLVCLLLSAAPALPLYAYGVSPYGGMSIPENWPETYASAQQEEADRVAAIQELLARSSASGDVQAVMCVPTEVKHYVARSAIVSDEALFADSLRDTPHIMREAASGILFHSPIGFRLNGVPSHQPERIFVAWDSSMGASSAVHAALPHIKAAKEVIIGCIDPVMTTDRDGQDPGTDIAAWLSHHGSKVTVSQYPSGGRETGKCIHEHAQEAGADLVVMGAYGHSRMIQTVLGGTTQYMTDQTDLPVLFAH